MMLQRPNTSFRTNARTATEAEPSRQSSSRLSSRTKAQRAEDAGSIPQQPDTPRWIPDRAALVRDDKPNNPHPFLAHPREGGDPARQKNAGFSLIETLVALAALSILAGAGMMMTDFAVTARATVAERDADATDLLRLRAALKSDLTQAAPRRARDQSGRKPQIALLGSGQVSSNAFLALVRRGWENPTGEGRASLQYVEYAFIDGHIERRHRRHLDGADTETPHVLIDGVADVDLAYLQHDQWLQNWAGSASIPLPDAVRIDIAFTDGAELSQLFLLPELAR